MPSFFIKDPSAVKDYRWLWSDWLAAGETISTATITAPSGITVDSDSITDSSTSVTVWLSGGTANRQYAVACKITTSAGRTDERSIRIAVQDQ